MESGHLRLPNPLTTAHSCSPRIMLFAYGDSAASGGAQLIEEACGSMVGADRLQYREFGTKVFHRIMGEEGASDRTSSDSPPLAQFT